MEKVEIINDATMGVIRHNELLFVDGKLLQREVSGVGDTRFVDVTEDVAKAIASYYDGLTIYEELNDEKIIKSAIETVSND